MLEGGISQIKRAGRGFRLFEVRLQYSIVPGSQIPAFAGSAAFADYGAPEVLCDAIPSKRAATQPLRSRVSPCRIRLHRHAYSFRNWSSS
jgi:hypothetical protein